MRFILFMLVVSSLFLISCSLFLDHKGPIVTIQYPVQNGIFPTGEVRMSGTAYDEESAVKNVYYRFNGITNKAVFLEGAWNGVVSVDTAGSYKVEIWAVDLLKNSSDIIWRDFTVTNRVADSTPLYLNHNDDTVSNALLIETGKIITNALMAGTDEQNWFIVSNQGLTNILSIERIFTNSTNGFWISLYTNTKTSCFETRYFGFSDTKENLEWISDTPVYIKTYAPLLSNEIRFAALLSLSN